MGWDSNRRTGVALNKEERRGAWRAAQGPWGARPSDPWWSGSSFAQSGWVDRRRYYVYIYI